MVILGSCLVKTSAVFSGFPSGDDGISELLGSVLLTKYDQVQHVLSLRESAYPPSLPYQVEVAGPVR